MIARMACCASDVTMQFLQGDLAAGEMIHGVEGIDPTRRQQLIDLLDIDLHWRLNRISDGQRRRVQICMGLLKPYKVSASQIRRPAFAASSLHDCFGLQTFCRPSATKCISPWYM